MYLLYCDETNLDPNNHAFFIYGGIAVSVAKAKLLHDKVEEIRHNNNIAPDFLLKFNPKPENLTHHKFITVKQAIIEASIEQGCTLIVSIILHNIATNPDEARRKEINRIAYHFHCLLQRENDYGLVLVDRFSDRQIDTHLREKFAIGLCGLPYQDPMRLESIIGYHYSAIGQSHFGSIVDIVLGSLRFAVNAHATQDHSRLSTATTLLRLLSPLFIRNTITGEVGEISLFFSPKVVRVDQYREQYTALKSFLAENGIEAQQEITDVRMY